MKLRNKKGMRTRRFGLSWLWTACALVFAHGGGKKLEAEGLNIFSEMEHVLQRLEGQPDSHSTWADSLYKLAAQKQVMSLLIMCI